MAKPKYITTINAGRQCKPRLGVDDIIVRTLYSKVSRRMIRRNAVKNTHIERSILAAQRERSEAREASENSHAARRLLDREREHRAAQR